MADPPIPTLDDTARSQTGGAARSTRDASGRGSMGTAAAPRLAHAGSWTDAGDTAPLAEAPDAGEITQPVASIVLPQQVLQPGELVILMIKPSVWFILLESLRSLAIIAGAAGLAILAVRWDILTMGRSDVVLGAGFLIVVRLFWQFLEWLSRLYILTDRRVVRVKGVLRVDIFEAPLKQIQHTNLLISLRQRVTGLGTVTFTTAGTGMIEAAWTYVADPVQVHQTVLRVLHRYR